MEKKRANAEILIAEIAGRQHGVVALSQLEGAGLCGSALTRRVRAGRLHRVHRGVYAVGHTALSREGRWLAAVLSAGPDAVLSHLSAGVLWGVLSPAGGELVHVTVPGQAGRRSRAGLRVHRSVTLGPGDVTRRRDVPVTTAPRTLADLRRSLPPVRYAAALRQAEYLGLPIGERVEADGTRSELEARFLALCRRHRIPLPEVNVRIGRFVVDFLWRERRLIVELDGYRFHRGRSAFEDDRARDLELKMAGWEVIRLTWRRVAAEPARTAAALRELLGLR